MKKFLLISLLSLSFTFGNAQTPYHPFPEDSAQWSIWVNNTTSIKSFQLKMFGDTLINGINYNKIYKSPYINYPPLNTDTLHCFIRQDTAQRKVYVRYPFNIYNDSSEILLYNFNLHVNDTFNIKLIADGTTHPFLVTYVIDSVQTNIDFRRQFEFQPVSFPVWGPGCDYGCQWFEGIGNFCNFLYTEIPVGYCDSPNYHQFNTECFWQNGIYVTGGTYCDYNSPVEVNEPDWQSNKLEIIPNPVTDESAISLQDKNITEIKIINSSGQVVLKKNSDINNFKIIANDFKNGIYILLSNSTNNVYSQKFIVNAN